MGRYRDDVENVNEAIALWNEYREGTLNGVPSIGILVHTPGQSELEDKQVDLVSGKTVDLDMIRILSKNQYRRGCYSKDL